VVEEGDGVVVSVHITARGKTSGAVVDMRSYAHFKLRGDKVVYIFDHGDRAAALEAIGLSEWTMTQENVQAMQSLYDGFGPLADGADVPSYVDAHYNPDCEYHPVEEEEPVRGREAVVGWIQRWFEVWDEMSVDVDHIVEPRNDVVLTAVTVHGRGAASDVHVDQRFFHVCDMRAGKVVRMREYVERDQALEAVGLSEQEAQHPPAKPE
jgi:ketosteroid isomerase-like protein